MKKFFCSLCFVFIATYLLAVPAISGVQTVTQPDGTTIDIELYGDEFYHFATTADGFLLIENAAGFYEYAELTSENSVRSLGVKAQNARHRSLAEKNQLAKIGEVDFARHRSLEKLSRATIVKPKAIGTRTLPARCLVLLVEFADVKFGATSTAESLSEMFNGETYTFGGATGSVRQYFSDQSNGKYQPQFDVVGPITLPENEAYYGGKGTRFTDIRPHIMVNQACSIADADFGVDFTLYNADGDNFVDLVYVLYAGYGENQGAPESTIWPHRWTLKDAGITAGYQRKYDDVYVNDYACSNELRGASGNTRDGIGTFCHEFSHVLGLADYYDTSVANNNGSKNPQNWSLMSHGNYLNGGKTPPNYSAFDKYFMGWIQPKTLTLEGNTNTLQPGECRLISAESGVPSANYAGNVWYFENRQKTGWDAYLPGHGLLITRVNFDKTVWEQNTVNASSTMRYEIICANPTSSVNSGGAVFPGTGNVTSATICGEQISNIAENSGVISFKAGVSTSEGWSVMVDVANGTAECSELVQNGEMLEILITLDPGFAIDPETDVLISMGDADLFYGDDFAFENSVLTIPNVAGDVFVMIFPHEQEITAISENSLPKIVAVQTLSGCRLLNLPVGGMLRIVDSLGATVLVKNIDETMQTIALPRGVYFAQIESQNAKTVLKILR